MNKSTYIVGFQNNQEEVVKDNYMIITNPKGKDLRINIHDDGTFQIFLDDLIILPQASNHIYLKSIRLREKE